MFEIVFYCTKTGDCPILNFLEAVDGKMQAKIMRNIAILKNNGYLLREPLSKSLNDGIFKLRTQVGNNETRVLYFFVCGKKIVMTNGFVKKSQKTPTGEIEIAMEYKKDYMGRGVQ